jgi:hypothetical protein
MKRFVKSTLKSAWRMTQPVRRPFLVKFEAYLRRCLRPSEQLLSNETNVLMEHVIRELVRLQRQVEYLQQTIEEQALARDESAIAGEIAPGDKLKAG